MIPRKPPGKIMGKAPLEKAQPKRRTMQTLPANERQRKRGRRANPEILL